MNFQIETLKITRNNLINLAKGFTIEELNYIPEGFKNNLIWNLGHVLVTHQILCYQRAGLESYLPQNLIDRFKKGSFPDGNATEGDLQFIIHKFPELADQTLSDYELGRFNDYEPYQTSYGVMLNNITEAITFNNIHEGLHLGYARALARRI